MEINYFKCAQIWAHYSLIIMHLNIGTPKNHHFPFGLNENVVVLAVPILKHFRVVITYFAFACVSIWDLRFVDCANFLLHPSNGQT